MEATATFFSDFRLNDLLFLAEAALRTLWISGVSITLGTLLGLVFGWLLYEGRIWGSFSLSPVLDIFRSIPLIIQLVLFYNFAPIMGWSLDPFASGAVVLTTYTSALVANVARGGIESVGLPLRRASRSLGMTYWQDIIYVVSPIGIRAVFPAWVGVALGVMKDSALVSVLGYIELLKASQILITRTQQPFLMSRSRGSVLLHAVLPGGSLCRRAGEEVGTLIQIRDLHKYFGELHVLKGIDLDVQKSEVLSIVGASGSGKSTLLYCINALETIDQGSIVVDGENVHAKSTDINRLRQKLGMVFQQWNSFPHLTALENVALSPRIVRKLSRQESRDVAGKQLEHVGLGDKLNSYPSALSGGQQQRLAIARALAMEPSYMLFDEATSALDPELVGEVLDTMRLLAEEGMTMICVTHEMGFARDVSDRIAYVHLGLIEEIGPPEQIFGNPQSEQTRRFWPRSDRRNLHREPTLAFGIGMPEQINLARDEPRPFELFPYRSLKLERAFATVQDDAAHCAITFLARPNWRHQ